MHVSYNVVVGFRWDFREDWKFMVCAGHRLHTVMVSRQIIQGRGGGAGMLISKAVYL